VRTGRIGAAACTAAALACAGPAVARGAATLLVFEPAFTGAGTNPCFDRQARHRQRLDLQKEITQAPGLPPKLISCMVPAGFAAKAATKDMVVGLYAAIGPERHPRTPMPATGTDAFELVVLSGPTAGQDTDYNRWYDREHIPAVLENPGFTAAQRLRLVSSDAPSGYALPPYGAWYAFRSGDWTGIMNGIRHKLATGEVRSSPAFDYKTGVNRYYALVP